MLLPALYNHLDAMQWRYATKEFESSQKLDKETLYALMEILRLTPTTFGLQLWRFVVVSDPELRKKLKDQCTRFRSGHPEHPMDSASHIVIFCRPSKFEPALIDQHIEHVALVHNKTISELHTYSQNLHQWAEEQKEFLNSWMDKQAYLALGSFMAACAAARIDTSPIDFFSRDAFDTELNLIEKHWHSVVACSIGVRSPKDKFAQEKKVRYPVDDLVWFK